MSDLQCPARFLACAVTETTAEELRHERVAAVYDGTSKGLARALADDLGVPVRATAHPVAFDDVVTREAGVLAVLSELADLHRGETVVVAVEHCSAEGSPSVRRTGRRVEVRIDADGVTVVLT